VTKPTRTTKRHCNRQSI